MPQIAEMDVCEIYVMSAALHVGIRDSTYAWSFRPRPTEILQCKNWGAGIGLQTYVTPTAILINADEQFVAFGYDAEDEYEKMLDSKIPTSTPCHLYTRLDKQLKNCKMLTKNTNISSVGGHIQPALDLFVMSLKYLKDRVLTDLSRHISGETPPPTLIHWVLMEPQVGSNRCTEFMREAALRAGLMTSLDSKHVLTCSEAEAASFCCLQMEESREWLKPGVKYLVMNANSESVDISIWDTLPGRKLKEIDQTIVTMGSDEIKKRFIKLLERIFGTDFINQYKEEYRQCWNSMLHHFKRQVVAHNKNRFLKIALSWDFNSKLEEVTGKSVENVILSIRNLDIKFCYGMLSIHESVVKCLYKPVVENVLSETQLWMGDPTLPTCQTIFLVGSFSELEGLQEAVKERLGSRCNIATYNQAGLGTIHGAVLLGHNPGAIVK